MKVTKIGLYHSNFGLQKKVEYIRKLISIIKKHQIEVFLHVNFLSIKTELESYDNEYFADAQFLNQKEVTLILSLGGDGTLLECALVVGDTGIPVLGINLGRLGFISSINKHDIQRVLSCLLKDEFYIEKRSLLSLNSDENEYFTKQNYALNDFIIKNSRSNSMLSLRVNINDEWLTNYWGDGIIISTPTGSTAYSLSCGGPILLPDINSLIITPICPHNLSVRPIVVPDSSRITVQLNNERSQLVTLSLDARSIETKLNSSLSIQKHPFSLKLLKPTFETYLNTLRNKLMWGADYRN